MPFEEAAPKDAVESGRYIVLYDSSGNEERVPVSALTSSLVGLENVDNTADANKPVSTAQQAAIDAHANSTSNPHSVTKSQVGLGSADNTADTAKPVSTAQQAAIDAVDMRAYASITAEGNSTATTISTSSTDFSNAVQVLVFDTNGAANDATPSHTNDHITIGTAGTYRISARVSFNGGSGRDYSFAIFKNNGATQLGARSTITATGNTDFIEIEAQVALSASDTVELWVQNEGGTENLTCEDLTLSLLRVG